MSERVTMRELRALAKEAFGEHAYVACPDRYRSDASAYAIGRWGLAVHVNCHSRAESRRLLRDALRGIVAGKERG